MDGFKEANGMCKSIAFNCPFGDPAKDDETCEAKLDANWQLVYSKECPATHFCQFPSNDGQGGVGHCCAKPKAICPVGQPHPTAKCNVMYAAMIADMKATPTMNDCVLFKRTNQIKALQIKFFVLGKQVRQ